ncbi:hypothetical protein OGAPHI_000780 [Ogataea philodendri]|uniref:Uncharacterized protein n=1 Tax=Ogataea philodendri TaxID=1378263 RepID=A0A9P8PGZ2_9ASCO|nr:uncharacterized protein OGAPHI_000780 [Ogataea philodendri]KAH3671069.1 hypothetical protein OGAPHI_000780 [Ogataea philodendri]
MFLPSNTFPACATSASNMLSNSRSSDIARLTNRSINSNLSPASSDAEQLIWANELARNSGPRPFVDVSTITENTSSNSLRCSSHVDNNSSFGLPKVANASKICIMNTTPFTSTSLNPLDKGPSKNLNNIAGKSQPISYTSSWSLWRTLDNSSNKMSFSSSLKDDGSARYISRIVA